MTEKDMKNLEIIFKAIPQMSDFQKGRLFGMAEAMEEQNQKKQQEEQKKEALVI
jgi:hypothetical protein